jgi:PBP1b-binding outer membrane lipoprotein LpoB
MRRLTAAALVVVTLAISGCASTAPEQTPAPAVSATPQETRTEVDWDKYPTDAQRLIDEAQAAGDCDALQDSFDVADNAGFLDQMKYIEEAREFAGCYE